MASSSELPVIAQRLEGKVAVITGGASGIGLGTVKLFCRHGAKVVVADIQDELGIAVCSEIGPSATYIHCDVTNENDISTAIDHAVAIYGKLDIMFNNAGIAGPADASILKNKKEDFERLIAVNLLGPFLGTKHAARVMIPARQGCIINTSGLAGCVGGVASHAYISAKHGVVGLTKNSAAELGQHGIRANCVSPGGVATPMATKYFNMSAEVVESMMDGIAILKRVTLKVEDVASTVLFLASDDAKYVNGQNISVDGGHAVINTVFDSFKVPKS